MQEGSLKIFFLCPLFWQDGDLYGVYGQRYGVSGAQNGTEFQVNSYTTSSQQGPNVASLNIGGVVITWQSFGQDGDDWGVYGQRYDSNGAEMAANSELLLTQLVLNQALV